jgi:hypothetical protein
VLKFQVREDELLTRLKRRARADDTDAVNHVCRFHSGKFGQ